MPVTLTSMPLLSAMTSTYSHLFNRSFPGITHIPTLLIRVLSRDSSHTEICPLWWMQICGENQGTTSNCFCKLFNKTSSTDQLSLTHKKKDQVEPLRCAQPVLNLKEISLNHHPCQPSFSAMSEGSILSREPDCSGARGNRKLGPLPLTIADHLATVGD